MEATKKIGAAYNSSTLQCPYFWAHGHQPHHSFESAVTDQIEKPHAACINATLSHWVRSQSGIPGRLSKSTRLVFKNEEGEFRVK
jgi:hypothetical protein